MRGVPKDERLFVMNRPLVMLAVAVGILLLVVAVVYAMQPAQGLPHFLPGYDATLAKHHYKHAIAAFFLGLGAFAYAWFTSGQRTTVAGR